MGFRLLGEEGKKNGLEGPCKEKVLGQNWGGRRNKDSTIVTTVTVR